MRSTRSSRGVSDARTRVTVSLRLDWIAASTGDHRILVLDESPRWLSSSSPIGVSRLIGFSRGDIRTIDRLHQAGNFPVHAAGARTSALTARGEHVRR
jgi:hypothetical protein